MYELRCMYVNKYVLTSTARRIHRETYCRNFNSKPCFNFRPSSSRYLQLGGVDTETLVSHHFHNKRGSISSQVENADGPTPFGHDWHRRAGYVDRDHGGIACLQHPLDLGDPPPHGALLLQRVNHSTRHGRSSKGKISKSHQI